MEFTFKNTPQLQKELSFLTAIIDKKVTLPALQNICVEPLGDSQLKLTTSDLDCSVSTIIDITKLIDSSPGLINGRKLTEQLSNLPSNADCSIKQLETEWIELKSGRSKSKLAGQSRDNYPQIEHHELSQPIELPALKFRKLIENTIIGITQEESQRFILAGCQLIIDHESIKMVTTDSHRLALSSFSFSRPAGGSETVKLLIPYKCLMQLLKMLDFSDTEKIPDFFFSYSTNQLKFEFGSKTLYSKTLTGQFPNYNLVMLDEINYKIKFNKEELTGAIKRCLTMADQKTKRLTFKFEDNLLSIHSSNTESGQNDESIEIDYNALQAIETGYNGQYLMDWLNKVDSNEITFSYKDGKTQALLEPVTSELEYKYIVMSMRV